MPDPVASILSQAIPQAHADRADAAQAADRAAASANPDLPGLLPLNLADLSTIIADAIARFPSDPRFAGKAEGPRKLCATGARKLALPAQNGP